MARGPARALLGDRVRVHLAAGRTSVRGEDRYFHKALHNLSGTGPEHMIVKLGLAAADCPGGGGLSGLGGGPAGTGLG